MFTIDYETFVVFSALVSAPILMGAAVLLVVCEALVRLPFKGLGVHIVQMFCLLATALIGGLAFILWLVGLKRTYDTAGANSFVLPEAGDWWAWCIFAAVYALPPAFVGFWFLMRSVIGNRLDGVHAK